MPVVRYFMYVGGALLALLFISGLFLPKSPVVDRTDSAAELPAIRIHSDRKWPERVVFDTSIPTVVPAQTAKAEAIAPSPTPVADVSARVRVREAFAQMVPPEPKKPEAKPQRKRKIAKNRVAPPMIQVAQQPRFGFFNTW
jgi:hypothetical protein